MVRARELRDAGWALRQTAAMLEEGTGVAPSTQTVLYWTDPAWTERLLRGRRQDAARVAAARPMFRDRRPEFKLERVRALHARKISMRAIAQLLELDFGDVLSEAQVRHALG